VAIARALVTDPTLIVADEPTGDLDRVTAAEVLDLLDALHRELGKTIVMVTHDPKAARAPGAWCTSKKACWCRNEVGHCRPALSFQPGTMFLLRLLLKNAFRHKLRTVLTMVGLVVAICAFGLLRTIVDAWYAGVEGTSSTRLITRSSISLTFPLPLSYAERLRSVEGVTGVSWSNWFGGVYITERNFFPSSRWTPPATWRCTPNTC
jgi:hypothetical protein